MTKEELIEALQPFTDDIKIFRKNEGIGVEVQKAEYEMLSSGEGIIILE